MGGWRGRLRANAARLLALAIALGLYAFARLPELPAQERRALATRFHFTPAILPAAPGEPLRSARAVNPSLAHISAWISSLGGAVALNDLDGDGLANDLCHVDPRTDRVVVAPAPGTGARFPAHTLDPAPLPYDPATTAPMGCLPGDLDEDGRVDLLVYYWGRAPVAFLRDGDGYRPLELVPGGERWYTNAATLADLDGDGHADLVLGNYYRDGARILDAAATGTEQLPDSFSRAFNGGSTRFFLWTEAAGREPESLGYRAVDPGLPPDVIHAWTLALGAADLDGDLLPEVYFANDFGPDRLLHNRSVPGTLRFALLEGERSLFTPPSKVLGRDSFKGMGVDFGDVNGDGRLDLYVSNIAAEFAAEESHYLFVSTGDSRRMSEGVAPYVDRSEPLGLSRNSWGWDARLADFDNDGTFEALQATGFLKGETNRWPELQELALGNDGLIRHAVSWPRFAPGDDLSGSAPNAFYVRGPQGRYHDLAPEVGLDAPHVTRAIAVADIDGDGDLDFALGNQWEASYLYRNDCPRCGAFLGLHLRVPVGGDSHARVRTYPGPPSRASRAAIGATASVLLPDGRRLVAEVDGGSGHSGKRGHGLHFGLGKVAPDAQLVLDVRWRDGSGTPRAEQMSVHPGWHTVELPFGRGGQVAAGETGALPGAQFLARARGRP